MPTEKEKIIQLVKQLPNDVGIDDVMAELYFKLQVDAGLKDLENGRTLTHSAVKERLNKWLKK